MKDYLISAIGPDGHRVVERIAARSAQEALEQLQQRGFRELQLQTDDLLVWAQPSEEKRREQYKVLSPKAQLALLNARSPWRKSLIILWNVYRQMWLAVLVLIGIFIMRRAEKTPLGGIDALLAAGLLAPLVIYNFLSWRSRAYRQIQIAAVEGRWNDVLKLAPRVEKSLSPGGIGSRIHGTHWRAKALARLGRWDEALAVMNAIPVKDGEATVPFISHLAQVYSISRRYEDAMRCYQKLTEVAPNDPMGWLGLAETLVVRLQKPALARDALDRLKSFPLSKITSDGVTYMEGAISLAEGHFREARESLQAAATCTAARVKTMPISLGLLSIQQTLLAFACAGMGDAKAAELFMNEAMPLLRVHESRDLVESWKVVLPPDASLLITSFERW